MATTPSWSDLPLSEDHSLFLAAHAITPSIAEKAGLRTIAEPDDLPEEFRSYGQSAVPAILFPWTEPDGTVRNQLKPPPESVTIDGKTVKYIWGKDSAARLGAVTTNPNALMVLIVEGTKQSLAAAAYAPEGVEVYGIAGCRMWSTNGVPTEHLMVVDGKEVVIILDADADTNLDVYNAGVALADACRAEGASSVKFVRLPAGKKAGLDDVLGARPENRRASYLARLIEAAKAKPADQKPKPKRVIPRPRLSIEGPTERGMIVVNGDRYQVIQDVTRSLLDRWNAHRLFCYGGVLSQRRSTSMVPVTRDAFGGIVAETAVTVVKNGEDGEEKYTHAWPDAQTMGAVLADSERFARLDRLSQIPFVRPDGTICQTPGYDETTRTFLVLDEKLVVSIPEHPTKAEIGAATKLLTEEWLGDFPFPTEADRANVLALALTPFIRGLVPLAPLAVVDGKEAGSGKNLLADIIAILVTGRAAQPLPYTTDDAEQRKVITSAFRSGAELFVFDEAHQLDGPSFARAITSITYQDRVLGVSNLAEFPNNVTWMSLGNRVQVFGDMGRRVYRIELAYEGESPENRPTSDFRHPDLRGWTLAHRADLLTACLTLIRAWFSADQPVAKQSFSMGSFEAWQKTVGGVVEVAGMNGFLGNIRQWRSESDFERQHWVSHLRWLYDVFGPKEFTTRQVTEKLDRDRDAELPHGMEDPAGAGFTRKLGQAYAKVRGRRLDGYRLEKLAETGQGKVIKWKVTSDTDSGDPFTSSGTSPDSDGSGAESIHLGGGGGKGGDPLALHVGKKHAFSSGSSQEKVCVFPGVGGRTLTSLTSATSQTAADPVDHLANLTETRTVQCEACNSDLAPVPPGNFWYACPVCHPATFTRD